MTVGYIMINTSSNQPLTRIGTASNISQTLKEAETRCRDCKTASPMVCVERCDVWRVKNEIMSVRQKAAEKGHPQRLFNAVKNLRRLKLLDALSEKPRTLTELQKSLKQNGFHHSRSTISLAYVDPLLKAGLVQEDSAKRFKITFYGQKVQSLFHTVVPKASLPMHSCCYEEVVVKELMNRPKTFSELAESVPRKSLARILTRLRTRGLLTAELHKEYVFYNKIKGKPRLSLSPTEKRIFDIIPLEGISSHQISKEARITLRRTYKYLRRLREKKLVFALKKPRTYVLTEQGKEVAAFLGRVNELSSSAVMPLLQR
jgi:predicted transcriptional regulator